MPRSVDTDVIILPSGQALKNDLLIRSSRATAGLPFNIPAGWTNYSVTPVGSIVSAPGAPRTIFYTEAKIQLGSISAAWYQHLLYQDLFDDTAGAVAATSQGNSVGDIAYSFGGSVSFVEMDDHWWFEIPDPTHVYHLRAWAYNSGPNVVAIGNIGSSSVRYSGDIINPSSLIES